MLAKRIIPCLDVRNGRVVKGKKFQNIIDVDSPEVLAEYYSRCGADELVFYDITASNEDRKTSLEFVEKVAANITIPFCVGGGVSSVDDFTDILRKGADKVSVNTAAVENPRLLREASLKYGAQCVVLSIDAKKNEKDSWDVYIKGGREKTDLDVIEWAVEGVKLGVGEIVINSIDEDGMKKGYDIELLKRVTESVNVPVVASGGAGRPEDFYDAIKYGSVDAVLAASVFHYGEIRIQDLKKYLKEGGIEVRI